MKLRSVLVVALFVVGTTSSSAWAAMKAQEFVNKAAVGGMFEVESSQLALDKAEDAGVRDFAEEMVNEHREANQELKKIADEQKLSVPSEMDKDHKAKIDKLQQAEGDFKQTYVSMQVDAHKQAVELFQTYAEQGDNKALQEFAQKTLPTLKEHHEDITALSKGAKMTK